MKLGKYDSAHRAVVRVSGNEHKAWQVACWSHVVEVAFVAAAILVVNASVQTLRKGLQFAFTDFDYSFRLAST